MTINVRDETGSHADFAAHATDVLTAVRPLIEDVTALPLPSCTFRLLDPNQYQAVYTDYLHRTIEREFTDYPATPEESRTAAAIRKDRATAPAPCQTLTTPDGRPETLFVPELMSGDLLYGPSVDLERLFAHEAVHHAQIMASAGIVVPPGFQIRDGPAPDQRPAELMEGHANWTELYVRYHLVGYWPPDIFMTRETYFVEVTARAINCETGTWNTIWTDPDRVPTATEIEDPASWLRRVGL